MKALKIKTKRNLLNVTSEFVFSFRTPLSNILINILIVRRCNKLFKSQLEVEYHATKSGHSKFSESTEEKKPLTDEEKQEQLRKLEERLKEKRKEREEKEKQEELEKERRRIQSGRDITEAKRK